MTLIGVESTILLNIDINIPTFPQLSLNLLSHCFFALPVAELCRGLRSITQRVT